MTSDFRAAREAEVLIKFQHRKALRSKQHLILRGPTLVAGMSWLVAHALRPCLHLRGWGGDR
eukprot:1976-Eustigmatos_ZCMA.PRE.1